MFTVEVRQFICLIQITWITLNCLVYDQPSSIINGDLATIEDFPYFAFLGVGETPEERSLLCGGPIIRPDIILTAGHCINNITLVKATKVFVGITTLDDLLTATPYEVDQVRAHPGYQGWWTAYDVGVIKLKQNITLDHVKVDTIKLAHNNPPIGATAAVMGFGVVNHNPPPDPDPDRHQLRYAVIKVVKIDRDDAIYTRGENQGTCSGDSGSPIVYDGEVIGVVSAGEYENCTGYDTQGSIPVNYYWLTKHMNCL